MKIGIDISQAIFGTGVSDYTIDLVNTLLSVDPTNEYVLFGSSLRRTADIKRIFPTARTFRFPPMLLHYLWNYLHVVNIENFTGQVDVFHTSDWAEPPASAPKVTTVHDLSPFLFPEEMSSGAFRNIAAVHAARMNWVVRESAKIICVSQSTAADLLKLFKVDPKKLVVIPEALPQRFEIRPTPAQIAAVKTDFGLSKYVVAIGTPQPRKNISRLCRAFLQFADKFSLPEKLVVVGGHGWGITDIPVSDRIVFTGYLPDTQLAALLAGSEVLAFPSLHEGFGLPILMGFYHHVPVVTSGVSSMQEVAGHAAVLVDPHSLESIAAGIAEAIRHRTKLVAAGNKRLAEFSWTKAAQDTLITYSQVC
jgi:glycosyltransferase involved in cell wall biosynthesis